MSGVGKGIATASIGKILQSHGLPINLIKIDPYLNVDAGTMNPTEHGEVFVLRSGLECDQDMGNYERFLNKDLEPQDYITSGMVYRTVIERERSLGYRGKCVEAIPDIRDEIIRRIEDAAAINGSKVSVVEIGGTIGDYQNVLFIEAARVLKVKHPDDVLFIMVSYLPVPGNLGEMKTRPTQNAVRALNSYGVQPDIILARSQRPLDRKRKEKIAIACSLSPEFVISAPDIESVYEVPLNFERDHLAQGILDRLKLRPKHAKPELPQWKRFVDSMRNAKKEVAIAIVGKYFDTGDFMLSDAYISVIEAIKYSSYAQGVKPVIHWLNAKDFEKKQHLSTLTQYDGILVPGGFGESGIEGKLAVINYARKQKIPYFGLCYGMQLLVIEYARNVLGLKGAHTVEIDPKTKHPIIALLLDQKKHMDLGQYGGTMRLGAYTAHIAPSSIAHRAYQKTQVSERHRHRFEVNPEYIASLTDAGLVFSGKSPNGELMEIAELPEKEHPFFLGTQFHPEFQSRPLVPHPLFNAFITAAFKYQKSRKTK